MATSLAFLLIFHFLYKVDDLPVLAKAPSNNTKKM